MSFVCSFSNRLIENTALGALSVPEDTRANSDQCDVSITLLYVVTLVLEAFLTCVARLQTHSDPLSCFIIDFLPNCIMVRNILCSFHQFSFVNASVMDQQVVANNSELENNVYSAIIWLGPLHSSIVFLHTVSQERPASTRDLRRKTRLQNKDPAA